MRQARREIDDVIAALKAKTTAIAQEAAGAGRCHDRRDRRGARSDARAAVDSVVKRFLEPVDAGRRGATAARGRDAGASATASSSAASASKASSRRSTTARAEIDVRGKRMRASVRDLRVVGGGRTRRPRASTCTSSCSRATATPADLNVIGCTRGRGDRAGRAVSRRVAADRSARRSALIHGYGTGQLKRALAGFLQQHPLVARFATAPPEQGGGGVTVVELKD